MTHSSRLSLAALIVAAPHMTQDAAVLIGTVCVLCAVVALRIGA